MIVTHGPSYRTRPGAVHDAVTAWQTAAWRAPGTTRFDSRPANDFLSRADAIAPTTYPVQPAEIEETPRWIVIAIGCGVAAMLGALLGGMMSV